MASPDEEGFKAAIREFFGNSHPDDLLLLYFVGYLLVTENNRLWCALPTTDPSAVEKTAISAELVLAEITAAAARNIVVVLDAQIGVHQGCLPRGYLPLRPWDHYLQVEGKCEAILAASAGPDFSFPAQSAGPQLQTNSSLTALIVNGLLERGNEKQVTVAELALYLGTFATSSRPFVTRMDSSSGELVLAPSRVESGSTWTEAATETNSPTSEPVLRPVRRSLGEVGSLGEGGSSSLPMRRGTNYSNETTDKSDRNDESPGRSTSSKDQSPDRHLIFTDRCGSALRR